MDADPFKTVDFQYYYIVTNCKTKETTSDDTALGAYRA